MPFHLKSILSSIEVVYSFTLIYFHWLRAQVFSLYLMHNRDRNNNNLIAQIEALQAELESLHLALQEQQNNLQLGDTVEIINSYHNQRGIVGVITKVT